jgi:Arc/MetJ family transcription regulator
LTAEGAETHILHMKRTNLVLDEQLLKEATRLAGAKTYSGAVNLALQDFVRRARAGRILELAGTGTWDGDLATMRADAPRARKGKG